MNIDIETLKNYINDLEEQTIPLTKKTTAKTKQNETVEQTEITAPPVKQKRPYNVTEKKKEQLVMAREKRRANDVLRAKQKKLESAKLLLENELTQPKKEVPVKSAKELSDTEDERVVYVKMPKKKTTKKQIIIQDEDTTSSDESETVLVKTTKKPFGKSHRNRNSVVKIHSKEKEEREVMQPRTFVNYFCD